MALDTCPDCGGTVSSEAIACPSCGRLTGQRNDDANRAVAVVAIVVAGILAFVIMVAFLNSRVS